MLYKHITDFTQSYNKDLRGNLLCRHQKAFRVKKFLLSCRNSSRFYQYSPFFNADFVLIACMEAYIGEAADP